MAAPREPATAREPAARRVRMVPGGPVLVEGPVEVVMEDGRTVASDRFLVALCACRRSRSYPFCDTSHRRRVRADSPAARDPAARDPSGRDSAGHGGERQSGGERR